MSAAPPVDPAPLVALVCRLRAGERGWTEAAARRFDGWLDQLDQLDRDPTAREDVASQFLAIVAGTRHVGFFADLGVAPPDGFASELRVRLLPPDFDQSALEDWARRLFGRPGAAAWALSIPEDRWSPGCIRTRSVRLRRSWSSNRRYAAMSTPGSVPGARANAHRTRTTDRSA